MTMYDGWQLPPALKHYTVEDRMQIQCHKRSCYGDTGVACENCLFNKDDYEAIRSFKKWEGENDYMPKV